MEYKLTPLMRKYLDAVVRRMNVISKNQYDFTYELTDDGIDFISDEWFIQQSEGVAGTESGKSNEGMKFRYKMPPPSSFSKYTNDKSHQFAIAKTIQQKGIKAQNYAKEFSRDTLIRDNIEKVYREAIIQTINKQLI